MGQLNQTTIYLVTYERRYGNYIPLNSSLMKFEGVCENFTPAGKCAFRNKDNEMLLVYYEDIVQMYPLHQTEELKKS